MKKVRVEDAVGMVLGHDLTRIVPGEFKGAAFKKGHIVKEEDVEILKNMGKYNIHVFDLNEDMIHEDEAAMRMAKAAAGDGLYLSGPSEGKISIKAKAKGILKVNLEALLQINDIEMIMFATLHNNSVIEKDQTVAGTRIIPLVTEVEKIHDVEKICENLGKVLSIKEIKPRKVGIVVTGSEVFEGRIKDKFGPVLEEKIKEQGSTLIGLKFAPDDKEKIEEAIKSLIDNGAEIILTAGGMSVDADDVTPNAIENISDKVITYGSPVLPGAMFMLAYKEETPILGIPACGMYFRTTVLDLVLPRVLAGEVLTKKDITSLAHGGLCLGCEVCRYPVCPFGK
ncbi:molybdopterin-binding protein [Wukongibacter baidiensis]|uniref:molybdopterin-binding protein n=1 Tax=Wukongibacter baidiensis TaxID=1723361 RepID=UPI003D7FEB0D